MEIDDEKIQEKSNHELYSHMEDSISIEEDEGFADDNIKQRIHSIKFNHNDQYLAVAYKDGRVRIFNVVTKQLVCTINCNPSNSTETMVQSIKWRPRIEGRTNNILMAICRERMVEIHTSSRKIVNQITFSDTIFSCEYSHDGLLYALGLRDYSIRVFDSLTKKEIIKLGGIDNQKVTGHQSKIFSLKFVKEQKILISGGWDDVLIFWDLTTGNPDKVIAGPHIFAEGIDMNCFGEILTSSWRRQENLQIWDYETKELKQTIDMNTKNIDQKVSTQLYCCKFSKDYGKLIFCGGSNSSVVKIFTYKGDHVATIDKLNGACLCLDSSNLVINNEQYLVIGGGEGLIRIFKIKYKDEKW